VKLRREEAVVLLKELVATFNTIKPTEYVVLKNEQKTGFWQLHVKWIPQPNEKQTLQKIAKKHNLNVAFQNNQTIFKKS
jgi:hypothetical protein